MKAVERKKRVETALPRDPGYPQCGLVHYLDWLEQAQKDLAPSCYLEIGTETGASLSFATCTSFAVDPAFQLGSDVSRNKPELHQFQGPSDDFFASRMVERLGYRIDLAFLDGMHLFEYLLRDFIATEKLMAEGGTILMHDCLPITEVSANRDWDKSKTSNWVGDVWKILPVLMQWRPDLKIDVLDVAPTGLVRVRGLDPQSNVLSQAYDEIVEEFVPLELRDYGIERFVEMLPMTKVRNDADYPIGAWIEPEGTPSDMSIAIATSIRRPRRREVWGDWHFARALAKGFSAQGHRVRIDSVRTKQLNAEADVALVLHGTEPWPSDARTPSVHWVLYPDARPSRNLAGELRAGDGVVIASAHDPELHDLDATPLLQGFDTDVMYTDAEVARGTDIVFIGNNHASFGGKRPIVDLAVKAGFAPRIWGEGWADDEDAAAHVVASHLPNREVGALYRRAGIVLCDHLPSMKARGYVSNRIFDALACAAPVISDPIPGLPEDMAEFVMQVETPDAFSAAVSRIRRETKAKQAARRAFAAEMAERHSLVARADTLLPLLRDAAKARAASSA